MRPYPEQPIPSTPPLTNNQLLNRTILINWIMVLVPTILFLAGGWFFIIEMPWYAIPALIASFGSMVFVVTIISSNQQKFTHHFRETIVQNMIRCMDSSIQYEPKSYFYLKELMYSGLIETAPNVYKAENYLRQQNPHYTMEVAWAYAFKQTVRERGVRVPRQAASNENIIHGLFYKFTMPYRFKTNVIIRKDKEKGLMKMFDENPLFLYKDFFHVEMDHEEFEKEFQVYAQDETETRKLIGTEMMDLMLRFKNYYKCKVQLSLIDNTVYVSINSKRKYFTPGFILFKHSARLGKAEKEARQIFYLPAQMEKILHGIANSR